MSARFVGVVHRFFFSHSFGYTEYVCFLAKRISGSPPKPPYEIVLSTIYTNHQGENLAQKHKTIKIDDVGEWPAAKHIQISWKDRKRVEKLHEPFDFPTGISGYSTTWMISTQGLKSGSLRYWHRCCLRPFWQNWFDSMPPQLFRTPVSTSLGGSRKRDWKTILNKEND